MVYQKKLSHGVIAWSFGKLKDKKIRAPDVGANAQLKLADRKRYFTFYKGT